MKRLLVLALVTLVIFVVWTYGPSPYKILSRRTERGGLTVQIRVEIPQRAAEKQLESWCGTITQGESEEATTIIEFIDTKSPIRPKAYCIAGQVSHPYSVE